MVYIPLPAEQVIRRHRDSPCMSSLEMTRGAPSLVVAEVAVA